jgi:hypothetical protein
MGAVDYDQELAVMEKMYGDGVPQDIGILLEKDLFLYISGESGKAAAIGGSKLRAELLSQLKEEPVENN